MPTNGKRREDVQKIILALLLSRKGACPMPRLDEDYHDQEGEYIPWKELGHISLLSFLQSIPRSIQIEKRDGTYYVRGVASDKSKHVSSLVARQKSTFSKRPTSYRRSFRPSHYFPNTASLKVNISAELLGQIIQIVKSSPQGVTKDYILKVANDELPYSNITIADLERQLINLSHEVYMSNNRVYPKQQRAKPFVSDDKNLNKSTERNTSDTSPIYTISGLSSDENEDDPFSFLPAKDAKERPKNVNSMSTVKKSTCKFLQETVSKCHVEHKESIENPNIQYETSPHSERNSCSHYEIKDKLDVNHLDTESADMIISDRIKFRLEKLIATYPNGIWCADLPEIYLKTYKHPLNYSELGFNSVREFASYLPSIFHCKQPYDGSDHLLYNAKNQVPQNNEVQRQSGETVAAFYNIHFLHDEPEAMPAIVSLETSRKLIPEGVMTIGESVGQISVSLLKDGTKPYIEVYVVEVFTPTFFWIQLRKAKKIFDKFTEHMHNFYVEQLEKYKIPNVVLEKGLNCACVYNGVWHRGIIKTVKPDLQVVVLFYDYGTLKTYPSTEIYYLHRSFSTIPAQAIPCGLYNVKPYASEKWSVAVTHQFAVRTSEKPLIAVVSKIDEENNSMMITLTDTLEDEDVHINDWLVEQDLAAHGEMVDSVDMTNMLVYVEENLLFRPEQCYGEDNRNHSLSSSANILNAPLISPQSTLNYKPPRPPPGLTLPTADAKLQIVVDNGVHISTEDTNAGEAQASSSESNRNRPFFQVEKESTPPQSISLQMFIQIWKENLRLQVQITAAHRALLARILSDPVNDVPKDLIHGFAQALNLEHQLSVLLNLLENINTSSNTIQQNESISVQSSNGNLNTSSKELLNSNIETLVPPFPFTATPPSEIIGDNLLKNHTKCTLPNFLANHNHNISNNDSMAVGTTSLNLSATDHNDPIIDHVKETRVMSEIASERNCLRSSTLSEVNSYLFADRNKSIAFEKDNKSRPIAKPDTFIAKDSKIDAAKNIFLLADSTYFNERQSSIDNHYRETNPFKANVLKNEHGSNNRCTDSKHKLSSKANSLCDQKRVHLQNPCTTVPDTNFSHFPHRGERPDLQQSVTEIRADMGSIYNVVSDRGTFIKKQNSFEELQKQYVTDTYHKSSCKNAQPTCRSYCQHELSDYLYFPTSDALLQYSIDPEAEVKQTNHGLYTCLPFDPLKKNVSVVDMNQDDEGYLTRPSTSDTMEKSPPFAQLNNEADFSNEIGTNKDYAMSPCLTAEAWIKRVENNIRIQNYNRSNTDVLEFQKNVIVEQTVNSNDDRNIFKQLTDTYIDFYEESIKNNCAALKYTNTEQLTLNKLLNSLEIHEASREAIHSTSAKDDNVDGSKRKGKFSRQEIFNLLRQHHSSSQFTRTTEHIETSIHPVLFEAVVLGDGEVYVFYFEKEAWLSTSEFIKVFTEFQTQSFLFSMLDIFNINVVTKEITRSEYTTMFSELDSTSLNAPRDGENKISKIHLLRLQSAMKILFKLKIVSKEDMERAIMKRDFVEGTLIHAMWILITAHGRMMRHIEEKLQ